MPTIWAAIPTRPVLTHSVSNESKRKDVGMGLTLVEDLDGVLVSLSSLSNQVLSGNTDVIKVERVSGRSPDSELYTSRRQ
jgi:hypothetical protein